MIKIVYIINDAPLYGANIALLNILDNLDSEKYNIHVITGFEGPLCKELRKREISYSVVKHYFLIYPKVNSVHDFLVFIPRIARMIIYNLIAERKLLDFCGGFKPDIIHTNIGPDAIGYHVSKKMHLPHVWHIREYQDLDFGNHIFPRKSLFCKRLREDGMYPIAITKGIYSHFEMGNNATIIYDGVINTDHTSFNPTKKPYFLFVGRLVATKGIEDLLAVFTQFSQQNETHQLWIAGSGDLEYETKLKEQSKEAINSGRIKFLGFRNDVYSLMSEATALIVPSRCEGFGFITVEAMYNGCLVIGKNTGGTKEILEEKELGILYSDNETLLQSLRRVAEASPESFFNMIHKAQNEVMLHYTAKIHTTQIIERYNQLLDKKSHE